MTTLWMQRGPRESFLDGDNGEIDAQIAGEIDRTGVELYATLLNFGHHDLMNSIYPLTARLLGSQWDGIVDDYLETFPPTHFNLNRAAKHFSEFVQKRAPELIKRFPYLPELTDYEWIELELLENNDEAPASDLDLLTSPEQFGAYAPVVNPAAAIRQYSYPIMKIAEQIEKSKKLPRNVSPCDSHVIVYRDPEQNRCRFMDAGHVAAAVVATATKCPTAYTDLMSLAVKMTPNVDPQTVVMDFLEMVENLQTNRLLLGNQKLA
jgi:hypothetical protein